MFFGKSHGYEFEIKLEKNKFGNFLIVCPIDPVKEKKGYGSNQDNLDLAFYIQRAIELCEGFAIYELITEKLVD